MSKVPSTISQSMPNIFNNSDVFSILSDSFPFACSAPIILPPFLMANMAAAGVIKSLQSLKSNIFLSIALIISIELLRKSESPKLLILKSTPCSSERRILIGKRLTS